MEKQKAKLVIVAVAFTLLLAAMLTFYVWGGRSAPTDERVVRVLAYSSFISAWGPGPEIAKRFEAKTGIQVRLQDGEDAGLLLRKLELFPSDVVVGLDQFALAEARRARKWKKIGTSGIPFSHDDFMAFDWAPVAFIYRRGEISPPTSLDDLLDPRFKNAIALPDPRTSSPGLQFFLWVLNEKGVSKGFEFLEKLKPNIHTIGPSWSAAYGVFQDKQAKLALSYSTSPVYHSVNEKDESYAAAEFSSGHPIQIEYAGIPENCVSCDFAQQFVAFLAEPEIQRLIMEKNYMLPVAEDVVQSTPFALVPNLKKKELTLAEDLLANREALLKRWQKLGL